MFLQEYHSERWKDYERGVATELKITLTPDVAHNHPLLCQSDNLPEIEALGVLTRSNGERGFVDRGLDALSETSLYQIKFRKSISFEECLSFYAMAVQLEQRGLVYDKFYLIIHSDHILTQRGREALRLHPKIEVCVVPEHVAFSHIDVPTQISATDYPMLDQMTRSQMRQFDEIKKCIAEKLRYVTAQAPTGTGKTLILRAILAMLPSEYKVLVVAPETVLVDQHEMELRMTHVLDNRKCNVTVVTHAWMDEYINEDSKPHMQYNLICIDEGHHLDNHLNKRHVAIEKLLHPDGVALRQSALFLTSKESSKWTIPNSVISRKEVIDEGRIVEYNIGLIHANVSDVRYANPNTPTVRTSCTQLVAEFLLHSHHKQNRARFGDARVGELTFVYFTHIKDAIASYKHYINGYSANGKQYARIDFGSTKHSELNSVKTKTSVKELQENRTIRVLFVVGKYNEGISVKRCTDVFIADYRMSIKNNIQLAGRCNRADGKKEIARVWLPPISDSIDAIEVANNMLWPLFGTDAFCEFEQVFTDPGSCNKQTKRKLMLASPVECTAVGTFKMLAEAVMNKYNNIMTTKFTILFELANPPSRNDTTTIGEDPFKVGSFLHDISTSYKKTGELKYGGVDYTEMSKKAAWFPAKLEEWKTKPRPTTIPVTDKLTRLFGLANPPSRNDTTTIGDDPFKVGMFLSDISTSYKKTGELKYGGIDYTEMSKKAAWFPAKLEEWKTKPRPTTIPVTDKLTRLFGLANPPSRNDTTTIGDDPFKVGMFLGAISTSYKKTGELKYGGIDYTEMSKKAAWFPAKLEEWKTKPRKLDIPVTDKLTRLFELANPPAQRDTTTIGDDPFRVGTFLGAISTSYKKTGELKYGGVDYAEMSKKAVWFPDKLEKWKQCVSNKRQKLE
ncbi:putative helicase [Emiliania huxleyi virus 86]|uniref:Putative helicase n=1 Tax=Emiliania huxleyi virus 86 (isolate United Kingdom/English Channel/1999) TaxID=654925 RepID=Q4A249_EHV8U|nr:putative helicase [Emiliania huxleyi virus 86]CAI65857.1 putative helicase [Emiliania huxleyi virus 86]